MFICFSYHRMGFVDTEKGLFKFIRKSNKVMFSSGAIVLSRQATVVEPFASSIPGKCFKNWCRWKANIKTSSACLLKPSINYAIHRSWTPTNKVNGTSRNAHIEYKERKCRPRLEIMQGKFTCKNMPNSTSLCWWLKENFMHLHIILHTSRKDSLTDWYTGMQLKKIITSH